LTVERRAASGRMGSACNNGGGAGRGFRSIVRRSTFPLHSIQNGIDGGRLEAYGAAGTALNLGGDFITVAGPRFELGEDEKLGAAILPRVIHNRQHISQ